MVIGYGGLGFGSWIITCRVKILINIWLGHAFDLIGCQFSDSLSIEQEVIEKTHLCQKITFVYPSTLQLDIIIIWFALPGLPNKANNMILGRFCVSVTSESKLLNIHYEWQSLVTSEFKCVSWCILEAPETGAFSKSGRSELSPLLMLLNAISCHQGTVCEINLFLQHSFNNIPMRVRFKFPFYSIF